MGIKISALPSVAVPALTDVFPIVQAGVTYKETVTQLSALIGGVVSGSIIGTANQITVTPGVGNVTLSTPQDIATTSDVTFGSVAFNPTTKGIVGTATNNNTGTGYVGEFVSSVIAAASAVSVLTAAATNLTSISLTAGDWDLWGNITFLTAATTSVTNTASWISSTSATIPDASVLASHIFSAVAPGLNSTFTEVAPCLRFSLSGTTTIYITGYVQFTVSTMTMCGGIYARRRR